MKLFGAISWTGSSIAWAFCYHLSRSDLDLTIMLISIVCAAWYWAAWVKE